MPTHEHVVSLADDDLLRKMQVAHGTKSVPTEALGGAPVALESTPDHFSNSRTCRTPGEGLAFEGLQTP
jgi:hypothetical protein